MSDASFSTPDLCDDFSPEVRVLEMSLQDFGGHARFCGPVVTVRCFEDNSKIKQLASAPGEGKVMVVDGGGSLRRALLGDLVAKAAVKNGWAGIIINGCVRDVEILATLPLGIKALQPCPLKTEKRNLGDLDVPLRFGGCDITSGDYIYADANGVVVSNKPLVS
jgi:regulator of ribonuclease activity A